MTPEQETLEQQRVARGDQARRLLEDRLFLEAVSAIQKDIWEQFKAADASDAITLQRVKLREEVLVDFLGIFQRHVQTGQIAKSNLQKFQERVAKALSRKR